MSPMHSLPQSHPNSQQINIAPPPPCKCDMPTYHNKNNVTRAYSVQILFC